MIFGSGSHLLIPIILTAHMTHRNLKLFILEENVNLLLSLQSAIESFSSNNGKRKIKQSIVFYLFNFIYYFSIF